MKYDYEKEQETEQMPKPEASAAVPAPESAPEASPVHQPMPALTAVSAKKRAPRLNAAPTAPSALPAPPAEPAAQPAEASEAQDGAQSEPSPDERVPVCDVQFRAGSKIYFFDPAGLELKNGDHVILDTSRGAEYGYCVIGNHRIARRELVQPLRRVLRLATAVDERIKEENEKKEKDAFAFCLRKIEDLGLDMQLVSTECAFDGSKLLFFFTADARVDFRELVRILASNYHTRIELRQIGVRDKAKMLGGLGICGRPFCCASFLEDFQPVSIKMAKTQNLSLNPTKISGTCGRLMCCLKYEQEAYEDLIKNSPKAESFVDTPDGRGTVTAVNLMRQSVTVRMEKDESELHTYRNSDILVLRSGKAKKNDPPIPEDLAPISGRREEGRGSERYSRLEQRLTVELDEAVLAEAAPETAPEPRQNQRQNRRERSEENPRRPRRERKQEGAAPAEKTEAKAEKPEKQEKPEKKPDAHFHRKQNRPAEKNGEAGEHEVPVRNERGDRPQASRQQRRRQQQGKQEPKLPQTEQPRRVAPEKRPEEQTVPKPESAKKPNNRRYYHNRKPKG